MSAQISNLIKTRHSSKNNNSSVFTDIYQNNVNIAIWQRDFEHDFTSATQSILAMQPNLQIQIIVSASNVKDALNDHFAKLECEHSLLNQLIDDIAYLVDMFCCLFDLKRTGLRLSALDQAMCPKFHVDKVPCRLVTTYTGIATQWLEHNTIDRTKLGHASKGLTDEQSNLYTSATDIQQLKAGDVALLKGESWTDNEGAGLVHRSPALNTGERRMLLTLDFMVD